MYFLILPLMFFTVTLSLNEPLNLARSVLLCTWVLSFAIIEWKFKNFKSKWLLLLIATPASYIVSALVNKQNFILFLFGNYNRNFGFLSLMSIALMVIFITHSKYSPKQFIHYGVIPVAAFSIVYSYIQSFDKDPIVWVETDRTVLTLGNSDYAAALLGILISLPLYIFLISNSKIIKAIMVATFLLILRAGLNSQAYQFRVLALATISIFLTLYFLPSIQKVSKVAVCATSTLILMGVTFFIVENRAELIARTSFTDRISQQSIGLRMFFDHPIFGVGIDQFWRYTPIYLKPADIQRNGSLVVPDKTHNLIIDHLAMGGILAGLTFIVFLVFSIAISLKLVKSKEVDSKRNEHIFLSTIWIVYVIHLFISTDNLFMMTFGYASFGLISQAFFAQKIAKASSEKIRKNVEKKADILRLGVIRATSLILLITVSFFNVQAISADRQIKKILTSQIKSGDKIIEILRKVPNPKASEEVIVYLLQNLQNCPVALVAIDDLLKLDNRSAQAWYFKTLCSDAANNQLEALKYIDNAIKLQPLNLIYLEARVRLLVRLEEYDEAKVTLKKMRQINSGAVIIKTLDELIASKLMTSVTN